MLFEMVQIPIPLKPGYTESIENRKDTFIAAPSLLVILRNLRLGETINIDSYASGGKPPLVYK